MLSWRGPAVYTLLYTHTAHACCLVLSCAQAHLPMQTLERAPVAPSGGNHVLFEQFWLEKGPTPLPDLPSADGKLSPEPLLHQRPLSLSRGSFFLGGCVGRCLLLSQSWVSAENCQFSLCKRERVVMALGVQIDGAKYA